MTGRHTDGQQVHEKMIIIANYQRNTNQNYNEVSPHTSQNGHHGKVYKQEILEEDMEKKELTYIFGGNVNLYNYCEE